MVEKIVHASYDELIEYTKRRYGLTEDHIFIKAWREIQKENKE